MTNRTLFAAGAMALGLTFAATVALAQPYGKGGVYASAPKPAASAPAAATHDPDCCPDA